MATREHRFEHVRWNPGEAGAPQAERGQDAGLKDFRQAFAAGRLDQATDQQVAHVRVGPTRPRRESEALCGYAGEQLRIGPGLVAPCHRLVVLGQSAIVADARAMLEERAKRVGLASDRCVQREPALLDEPQRAGRDQKFLVKLHHGTTAVENPSRRQPSPSTTALKPVTRSARRSRWWRRRCSRRSSGGNPGRCVQAVPAAACSPGDPESARHRSRPRPCSGGRGRAGRGS